MSGFSLCNSTSLRPCFSHSLCCCHKSRFSASSPAWLISICSGTSTRISFAPRPRQTLLKVPEVLDKRSYGFRSFAVKKRRNGGAELMEPDGLDEDGEEEDDDDEDEDLDGLDVGGEEGEDEGVFFPLEKMKKWLENKPSGFGEGKVYNTSIEDKLLDEIKQSMKAQSANLNKLKNEPTKPQPKREDKNIKGPEVAQIGIRVCVSNLPKKKNVHKDLKSALKGVSGILNITPAVSANKKTRDPVCKGFAFVDFRTDMDATRFVDQFSGQKILFGKVQKQIKCQVLISSSSTSSSEQECTDEGSEDEQEIPGYDLETVSNADFVVQDEFLDPKAESDLSGYSDTKMEDDQSHLVSMSTETLNEPRHDPKILLKSPKQVDKIERDVQEGDNIDAANVSTRETKFLGTITESELDDQLDMVDIEDIEENLESAGAEKLKDVGNEAIRQLKSLSTSSEEERVIRIRQLEHKLLAKGKLWGGADSDQPEQKQDKVGKKKKNSKKKKILAKGQAKKVPKLEIPGSSKRLKVKEKAVLTGVLSKYAAKAASASNDE